MIHDKNKQQVLDMLEQKRMEYAKGRFDLQGTDRYDMMYEKMKYYEGVADGLHIAMSIVEEHLEGVGVINQGEYTIESAFVEYPTREGDFK